MKNNCQIPYNNLDLIDYSKNSKKIVTSHWISNKYSFLEQCQRTNFGRILHEYNIFLRNELDNKLDFYE